MSTQNHEPVRAGAAAVALDVVTGVGSIFWFELSTVNAPECLDADGAKPAMSGQTQAQARHEGPEHTLLYVEDNLANLQLVEQLIARRPDMRLLSAVNGLLGIKMARDNQPDVILMDINLPGINGIEVLRILHEDRATATSPLWPSAPTPCREILRKACRQDSSGISPNPSRSKCSWMC